MSRSDAIARLESLLARVTARKDAPRAPAHPAPSPSATAAAPIATPAPVPVSAPVPVAAPAPVAPEVKPEVKPAPVAERAPEPVPAPVPETKPVIAPPPSAVASFLVDDSVMRAPTRQVTPRDHSESVGRPPPPRAPTPIPRPAPTEFKPASSFAPPERPQTPTLPPHEKPPPSGSIRALAASVVMPPSAETGFDLDTPTDVQFDASRRSPERRVVPPPPAAATSPLLAPPIAPIAPIARPVAPEPAARVEPEVKAEPVPLVAERFQPPPVTVTRDAVKVVQPPAPRPTTLRGMLQRSLGLRVKS